MSLWTELNDFSGLAKPIPCNLCGKDAKATVIGNHFKCEVEGHVFNKDGSPMPKGSECHCETCKPREKEKKQPSWEEIFKKAAGLDKKKKGKRKKKE
jgi:hypothetical protein